MGISGYSCALGGANEHRHVPTVLERRLFDDADLLDVLGEPHQQVAAPLRVVLLASPEHDRDLDLRPLVQEADDMAFLVS